MLHIRIIKYSINLIYFRIPKESLRMEIQRLVKSYPLQVRHIPEALCIFTVTSDNDRQCEVNRRLIKKTS
jgi:hypothetical protein